MVALAAGLAPMAAAAQCAVAPAALRANLWLPPPVLDNTQPKAAIQQRASNHHAGHAIGLYFGRLESRVQVKTIATPRGRLYCVSVTAIVIDLAINDRRIYLAHEWGPGSCPYTAILGHERKHEAADDRALRDAAPRMRRAVGEALQTIGPLAVPAPQRDEAKQRLMNAVQSAYRAEYERLGAERTRLQQAVDANFEYARITESCREFGAHYDPYAPLPPKGGDDPPLLPGLR